MSKMRLWRRVRLSRRRCGRLQRREVRRFARRWSDAEALGRSAADHGRARHLRPSGAVGLLRLGVGDLVGVRGARGRWIFDLGPGRTECDLVAVTEGPLAYDALAI